MVEPVQSLVVMFLERQGYFVRSNVRYATPSETPKGRTSAYGDLDIVAVRFDPTNQLMLDLARADLDDKQRGEFALRQQQAFDTASTLLGNDFRRVLYFGGRIPKDGGEGARNLLHPDVQIEFVRSMVRDNIGSITHREGNNPLCRVLNMLSEYGLTDLPDAVEAVIE